MKLKNEFNVEKIIFVGDRGMRIKYNINNSEDLKKIGIQFITGLTTNEIKDLISTNVIQLSLFSQDLAEVETEDDERFVLSVNPDLEYTQRQYLDNQREKFLAKLKHIKNSWNLRRLQNRDNELKIIKKETKNKKLKTNFNTKDMTKLKNIIILLFICMQININAQKFFAKIIFFLLRDAINCVCTLYLFFKLINCKVNTFLFTKKIFF